MIWRWNGSTWRSPRLLCEQTSVSKKYVDRVGESEIPSPQGLPAIGGCRDRGSTRGRCAGATAGPRRRVTLAGLVRITHTGSRGLPGSGGSPRCCAPAAGWWLRLIAELMAEQGLRFCQPCSCKRSALAGEQLAAVPDWFQRDFIPGVPGIRLVGHVT